MTPQNAALVCFDFKTLEYQRQIGSFIFIVDLMLKEALQSKTAHSHNDVAYTRELSICKSKSE